MKYKRGLKRPFALTEILIALAVVAIMLPFIFTSLYTHLKQASKQNEAFLRYLSEDRALLLATQEIMKGNFSIEELDKGINKQYPITTQGFLFSPEVELFLDEQDEQHPPKALLITVEIVPKKVQDDNEALQPTRNEEFYPKFITLCCSPRGTK
jgi:competence protein ComGC